VTASWICSASVEGGGQCCCPHGGWPTAHDRLKSAIPGRPAIRVNAGEPLKCNHDPRRHPVTPAAFEAISGMLPPGSVGFEREPTDADERRIWLEPHALRKENDDGADSFD
jgi:hypothetical protein